MKIDLSKCKEGQKLMLRDGTICHYKEVSSSDYYGCNYVIYYTGGYKGMRYKDGRLLSNEKSHRDVVKIFPFEKPKSPIKPQTLYVIQKWDENSKRWCRFGGVLDTRDWARKVHKANKTQNPETKFRLRKFMEVV